VPVAGSFTSGRIGLGAASSATARAALCSQSAAAIPTTVASKQVSDKILLTISAAGADTLVADLVSFDALGCTLNYSVVETTQRVFFALALKGGQYKVTVDEQKTSTGTKSKTGVGFQPKAVLFMGTNRVASASSDATLSRLSIGASDGSSEGTVWGESTDNVSTTDENSANVTTKVLRHASNPSTTDAEADLTSLDADGYTLDWTTADATAREFLAIAVGSNAVGAAGPSLVTVASPLRF
jgi:hypothetical protein